MKNQSVVSNKMRKEAEQRLQELSSRILSNLVMVGQIPALSGEEKERGKYLREHFTHLGLHDVGEDSAGNIFARLPGVRGKRTLGVFAGIDTIYPPEVAHHYSVTPTHVFGPGVAYNSLAASSLLSLAEFFSAWDYPLEDDLLFVGLVRCADQADQEGMRSFLDSPVHNPNCCLMLESIGLGRLSYFTVGCLKFDLSIEMAKGEMLSDQSSRNAINVLADAVNLLLAIELPRRPHASLNLGLIEGGESHEERATRAFLGAELRSESMEILARVEAEVDDIASHLSSYYGCQANLRKFGRRITSGLRFNHPLVRSLRTLLQDLGIDPSPGPDTTAGSLAMAAGIPTVTLGLTRGRRAGKKSHVEIEPIRLGLLQIILALYFLGKESA